MATLLWWTTLYLLFGMLDILLYMRQSPALWRSLARNDDAMKTIGICLLAWPLAFAVRGVNAWYDADLVNRLVLRLVGEGPPDPEEEDPPVAPPTEAYIRRDVPPPPPRGYSDPIT